MPVERIVAHPNVKADRGLVALQRGPVVYCLEQCDQPVPLGRLFLPPDATLKAVFEPRLLGGVTVLRGLAGVTPELKWEQRLYQPLPAAQRVEFTAIPYHAWDNRAPGAMRVWLPVLPQLWPESEAK